MKSLLEKDYPDESAWVPVMVPLGAHNVMSDKGRQVFDMVLQEPVKLSRLVAIYRPNDPTQKLGELPELHALRVGRLYVPLHPGEDDGTSAQFWPVSLSTLEVSADEPFLCEGLHKAGVVLTGLRIFAEVVNPGPTDCWVTLFLVGSHLWRPVPSRLFIFEGCDLDKFPGSDLCEGHLLQEIEEEKAQRERANAERHEIESIAADPRTQRFLASYPGLAVTVENDTAAQKIVTVSLRNLDGPTVCLDGASDKPEGHQ